MEQQVLFEEPSANFQPPKRFIQVARYREHLINILQRKIASHPDDYKIKAITRFLNYYNRIDGKPKALLIGGRISRSTIYAWLQKYQEGGVEALVPRYGGYTGIPKISQDEKACLAELLQEKLVVGSAIKAMKYHLKKTGKESPTSAATLRRWAERYLEERET